MKQIDQIAPGKPGEDEALRSTRLLLCELLPHDPFRHQRNELFPLFAGMCRAGGVRLSWRVMQISHDGVGGDRFVVDPEGAARQRLLDAISECEATHVVVNESLADGLREELRSLPSAPRLVCIGDLTKWEQERLKLEPVGEVWSALGLPRRGDTPSERARLLDAVEPVYDRSTAGPAPPFIFPRVLLDLECAYRRPIRGNPSYRDLDLSDASHDDGCAFCVRERPASTGWPYETPALDLAFKQIDALLGAANRQVSWCSEDGRPHFLVQGAAAFQRLEDFLARLCESKRDPCAFLFSCRADELLARAATLDRWLPVLDELGHAVHIWVMGVENFSDSENERFNKGIGAEQIFEARRRMGGWEQAYPRAFSFSRYGGFSFILFTPWSTPEDLRANVHWARKVGISPRGFFLRSRLQLVDGTPISLLARRDGLVVDRFDEPYFDSGCIQSHHERELFWCFRSTAVRVIHRLGSRLPPELRDLGEDALYPRVQQAIRRYYDVGLDAFDAFEALIDTVERMPEGAEDEILEGLADTLSRHPKAAPSVERAVNAALVGEARGVNASDRLFERASSSLDRLFDGGRRELLGHRLRAAFHHREGDTRQLRLDLEGSEGEPFRAIIEPRKPGRSYLASCRDFGIGYAPSTPPSTPARKSLLALLAKTLGNAV